MRPALALVAALTLTACDAAAPTPPLKDSFVLAAADPASGGFRTGEIEAQAEKAPTPGPHRGSEPAGTPPAPPVPRRGGPDLDTAEGVTRWVSSLKTVSCPSALPEGALSIPMDDAALAHIRALIDGRARIRRTVYPLNIGVRTETTSDDAELARILALHVAEMSALVRGDSPADLDHPLLAAMRLSSDHLFYRSEKTPDGIRVEEVSDTPEGVALIHAMAQLTGAYLLSGDEAARACQDVLDQPADPDPAQLPRAPAPGSAPPPSAPASGP